MLRKAKTLLDTFDASFVITGEVIGQRPMSQRRDSMNLIDNQSGLKDILLRPLCALRLPETLPERQGVVERQALLGISGRGRRKQVELAEKFGIDPQDIPTPAGGCLLTNEQIALIVAGFRTMWSGSSYQDVMAKADEYVKWLNKKEGERIDRHIRECPKCGAQIYHVEY